MLLFICKQILKVLKNVFEDGSINYVCLLKLAGVENQTQWSVMDSSFYRLQQKLRITSNGG